MIEQLLRTNILELTAYSSARSEFTGAAGIFLDANENAFGSAAGTPCNRYPDPLQKELKLSIAKLKGIAAGKIFLGNGSDEPIDLLMRAFCVPGKDNIIQLSPTYGMYEVAARINDIAVKNVPLTQDFQLDVNAILSAADACTKIIFICSPNNPTGNLVADEDIRSLLDRFNGLLVVDEAYIDYVPSGSSASLPLLEQYERLVVLQTFSKAWGLAALRLGMAFASECIIGILNKIKSPYNINTATQRTVQAALKHAGKVQSWADLTRKERNRVRASLSVFPFVEKVYPSDANFLLVKMKDADEVYEYLLRKGIVVRNRSRVPQCENCLRITIGTEAENQALLAALSEFNDMKNKIER